MIFFPGFDKRKNPPTKLIAEGFLSRYLIYLFNIVFVKKVVTCFS
jgi:hypothetical protein